MRTLRYETSTDVTLVSPIVDIFSANLTSLRRGSRLLLGRFAFGSSANLDNMSATTACVITGLLDMSDEDKEKVRALSSMGIQVYAEATAATMEDTISEVSSSGLTGIYGGSDVIDAEADITAAGLKLAVNAAITSTNVGLMVLPQPSSEIELVAYLSVVADLYPTVKFYLNEDPRHMPGIESGVAVADIVIPSGTIVATPAGKRFITVAESTLLLGSSAIDVKIAPLDQFVSVLQYEVAEHSLSIPDLYVTNDVQIDRVHTVIDSDIKDFSYVSGLAMYATLFKVDATDETSFKMSEPDVYLGESVISIDMRDMSATVLTTDIGTAIFDFVQESPVELMNTLTAVIEHDAGGTASISLRTAPTMADVDTMEFVPYSNDLPIFRYIQFSTEEEATCWIEVDLTDDGNTIDFLETEKMLDQLPLWMAWKTRGSVGYSMTNIIGNYANELFGDGGIINHYHLEDLDIDVNGRAVRLYVGYGWHPVIGEDVLVNSLPIPMAASSDELIQSRIPAFFISEDYIYIVNAAIADIYVSINADQGETVNLWTAFDEWGLFFNLRRFDSEGIRRFYSRIYDVFSSGFGSNATGLIATAERELSPVGIDTDTFSQTLTANVFDIEDESTLDVNGFPTDLLLKAVDDQRRKGVHTWGFSKVGKAIFDADGIGHEGQGRLPYAYDTDLSVVEDTNLLSGAGPKNDLKVFRGSESVVNPTIRMRLDGTDYVSAYTGRRLAVTIGFQGTADSAFFLTEETDFSVLLTAVIDGVTCYRTIIGYSKSNVNPNSVSGEIGYTNTNISRFNLIEVGRDGIRRMVGTWVNATDDPIFLGDDPTITSIGVTNADSLVSTRIEYTLANNTYANESFATGSYSETLLGGSLSNVMLEVMVAPFSAASGQSTISYATSMVTRRIMMNDTLDSGVLSGTTAVIRRPRITSPAHIAETGVTYTATVLEVTPYDNLDHVDPNLQESYDYLIGSNVLNDLKSCITLTPNGDNTIWTIEFDPSLSQIENAFPYVRREMVAVSSSKTVIVPKLENGETRVIELKDEQIPTLPETSENRSFSIISDTPGVVATLDGNKLYVTRVDSKSMSELFVNRGYYWINGEESYAYSYDDGQTIGPLTWAIALSSPTTSVLLPSQPAQFSLIRVIADGVELAYRFYETETGTKSFTSAGAPDYDLSFYVRDEVIYLSEAASTSITIMIEPISSSGLIRTGITTSPYSSWDDRFFVVLSDSDIDDYSLELTSDRSSVSFDRASSGCNDMILLSARVTDSYGNPVEGVEVDWVAPADSLYIPSVNSGADGRVTAYYSPVAAGVETIGVSVGAALASVDITATESDSPYEYLWIASEYPSMVQSGVTFNADVNIVGLVATSINWELSVIEAEGSENIDGEWPTPATGLLNLVNGSGTWSRVMTDEGLYRLRFKTIADNKYQQTLVWRVY